MVTSPAIRHTLLSTLLLCLVACGPTASDQNNRMDEAHRGMSSEAPPVDEGLGVLPHQYATGQPLAFPENEEAAARLSRSLPEDPVLNADAKKIKKAAEITSAALLAVSGSMKVGQYERDVKKVIADTFKSNGATGESFPAIAGSGPNSLDLHYTGDKRQLKDGDLVVVDIGAKWNGMCADMTRTFPASGKFSKRQREMYQLVVDTQLEVVKQIKAGKTTLQELDQIARNFMRKSPLRAKDNAGRPATMDRFLNHGVTHFLGSVVHAEGPKNSPIPVGRVFTVEPGVYIRSEGFGIRVEDDYVMTDKGAVAIVNNMPKSPDEIEKLMTKTVH